MKLIRSARFWQNLLVALVFLLGASVRLLDLQDPPLDFHPVRQLRDAIIARGLWLQMDPTAASPEQSQQAIQLVIAFPAKPRRHRPVNPHAAANALALQHRDIAKTVAGNISRRTGQQRPLAWCKSGGAAPA